MFVIWIYTFLVCVEQVSMRSIEPQCSPFDFVERTLDKVIRIENKSEFIVEEVKKIEMRVDDKLKSFGGVMSNRSQEIEGEMVQLRELRTSNLATLEEFKVGLERQNKQFRDDLTTQFQEMEGEMIQLKKQQASTLEEYKVSLENQTKQLKDDLTTQFQDMEGEMIQLKKQQASTLEEYKVSLENQTKQLKDDLTTQCQEMEGEMIQLKKQQASTLEEYKVSLEKQTKQLKDDLTTPTIVFKAKDAKVSHLSYDDTIVFPTLVMNEGGGYDSSTGVFIAPTNGTYLFSVQVCLYVDKWLSIRIVAADTVIAASGHRQDGYSYVCHKSDGVTVLSQGDEVMVTIAGKHSGNVIYTDRNRNYYWTSFSGVLIHK